MLQFLAGLPAFLVGTLVVFLSVFLAVGGLWVFNRWSRRSLGIAPEMNNDIIFFASAINAFYGLTVGLIAVGVWRNYNSVQDIVSSEAASLAALYRDVDGYPEPLRSDLQTALRDHLRVIIEKSWPAQSQGVLLDEGTHRLTQMQRKLFTFEPASIGKQLIHAEALRQFNEMAAMRRRRVESVRSGLPSAMWGVVLIGAILSITVTYLMDIEWKTHAVLTAYLAAFTGLVVYVIAGLDNPLSGPLAIPPDAYQLVLDRLMNIAPPPQSLVGHP